ncbi:tRNA(Ile)-lysidine synthetase [Sandaracinus amylolyticus]|uniref:tRNA(Ile)-lysidine synthase n=2 Tax=Sandaracinus amylolyticus TaxID=927083 RepID=A0A0F6W4Y6_9BACT|nr:tRNA(Ile)-lysidine synthetase [Sandaracinus amylolyticus]
MCDPMLLARVRRTIRERRLLRRGERVVVAVSGGPDSTAMLDVLARIAPELALELHVASVDHGLRAEAQREVELVAAHASALGLPFHPLRATLPTKRGSLQDRARAARYALLHALASELGASRIAVGHTLDDQAETVLARMMRGSGARGLAGIAPRRADGVVRPLIDSTRAEVRAWIEAHRLTIVDDPSNVDPRFQRARVRHAILPALAIESPAIARHLAHIADDTRALDALARKHARHLLARAAKDGDSLDAELLSRAPLAARREALRIWAHARTGGTIRRAHLDAMEVALQGRGNARLPAGWTASVVGGALRATHDPTPFGSSSNVRSAGR